MAGARPDNADRLWRIYHGSAFYHRYKQTQLNSSWQHQVALCGRETRTGNGSYSVLGPESKAPVCRKCQKLAQGG